MNPEHATPSFNQHAELEATLWALGLHDLLDRPALGAWNGNAQWTDTT